MNNENQKYDPIILPRHTYSESNALRFKSIFDKCLENKTDEFIPCEEAKLKITSLKQRCNEAFLWLTNNEVKGSKYTKENYKILRSNVKVKPVSFGGKDGVLISWFTSSNKDKLPSPFPKSITSISAKSSLKLPANSKQGIHWKERILKFIQDNTKRSLVMDDLFVDFQGNLLTDIDVEWITKTLTSAGIEFEVDYNKIIAAK